MSSDAETSSVDAEPTSSGGNYFFVPTTRGGKLLIYEDYIFRFERAKPPDRKYYKCRLKSCKARCVMKTDSIHATMMHNHEPETEELVRRETRREQKELKRLRKAQNIKIINRKPRPVSLDEAERFGADVARKMYRLSRGNYNDIKKEILQLLNWHLKTHGESWREIEDQRPPTKTNTKKPELDLSKLPGAELDNSDDSSSNDEPEEKQPEPGSTPISVEPDLSLLPGSEPTYHNRPVQFEQARVEPPILNGVGECGFYSGEDRTLLRKLHEGFVAPPQYW